jgi:hypothetical protein
MIYDSNENELHEGDTVLMIPGMIGTYNEYAKIIIDNGEYSLALYSAKFHLILHGMWNGCGHPRRHIEKVEKNNADFFQFMMEI